jgi:hypothetical protein
MDDMFDKIRQANDERRKQIQALSDAELDQIILEPARHSRPEVEYAREELDKRRGTNTTSSVQGTGQPTVSGKYTFLTAWIAFFVLYALISTLAAFTPVLFQILIVPVAGYFLFRLIVESIIIPKISKADIKSHASSDGRQTAR